MDRRFGLGMTGGRRPRSGGPPVRRAEDRRDRDQLAGRRQSSRQSNVHFLKLVNKFAVAVPLLHARRWRAGAPSGQSLGRGVADTSGVPARKLRRLAARPGFELGALVLQRATRIFVAVT